MPRIAYAQPGALPSAFAPIPAWPGLGFGPFEGKGNVTGQPGTQAVPTGQPEFPQGVAVNGARVRGAGGGAYAHGSDTMRSGAWYPQQWYLSKLDGSTLAQGNPQAMSVWSDNQMPIPASDPAGAAALLAFPPFFLGSRQVYQPPGSRGPVWKSWNLPTLSYGG